MTIRCLLELFVDVSYVNVTIYDLNSDKELFNGYGDEIPYELEHMEIASIDSPAATDCITINVDTGSYF